MKTWKTWLATATLPNGAILAYEIEAPTKKDANWHARRQAFKDGHRGVIHFQSREKEPTP